MSDAYLIQIEAKDTGAASVLVSVRIGLRLHRIVVDRDSDTFAAIMQIAEDASGEVYPLRVGSYPKEVRSA